MQSRRYGHLKNPARGNVDLPDAHNGHVLVMMHGQFEAFARVQRVRVVEGLGVQPQTEAVNAADVGGLFNVGAFFAEHFLSVNRIVQRLVERDLRLDDRADAVVGAEERREVRVIAVTRCQAERGLDDHAAALWTLHGDSSEELLLVDVNETLVSGFFREFLKSRKWLPFTVRLFRMHFNKLITHIQKGLRLEELRERVQRDVVVRLIMGADVDLLVNSLDHRMVVANVQVVEKRLSDLIDVADGHGGKVDLVQRGRRALEGRERLGLVELESRMEDEEERERGRREHDEDPNDPPRELSRDVQILPAVQTRLFAVSFESGHCQRSTEEVSPFYSLINYA